MNSKQSGSRYAANVRALSGLLCLAALLTPSVGCHHLPHVGGVGCAEVAPQPWAMVPTELNRTVLPTYRIEPPDILRIEAIRLAPRAPYLLRAQDSLNIRALGVLEEAPIDGIYPVEPGGGIRLGFQYGVVPVAGLTLDQAQQAIDQHLLQQGLREPQVSVSLAQLAPLQPISGEHLVASDGTVNLGVYGSVQVVGMTLPEARATIEAHLTQYLDAPQVLVDVFAYNSKRYYVIMQGAGLGDVVYPFPITGNETVLDAVAQVNGTQYFSSKNVWVARPSPAGSELQVLPVDWKAITSLASTETNYQLLPGDRVFVAEDKHVAFGTWVDKFVTPWERIMGFSILGAETATRFTGNVLQGGGNPRGFQ